MGRTGRRSRQAIEDAHPVMSRKRPAEGGRARAKTSLSAIKVVRHGRKETDGRGRTNQVHCRRVPGDGETANWAGRPGGDAVLYYALSSQGGQVTAGLYSRCTYGESMVEPVAGEASKRDKQRQASPTSRDSPPGRHRDRGDNSGLVASAVLRSPTARCLRHHQQSWKRPPVGRWREAETRCGEVRSGDGTMTYSI